MGPLTDIRRVFLLAAGVAGCAVASGQSPEAGSVYADETLVHGDLTGVEATPGPPVVVLPESPIDPWAMDAHAMVIHRRVAALLASTLEQGFGAALTRSYAGPRSRWMASCEVPRATALYTRHESSGITSLYGGEATPPKTTVGAIDTEEAEAADADRPALRELCLSTRLDADWEMVVRSTVGGHIETYFDHRGTYLVAYPPRRLPLLTPDAALIDALLLAGGCTPNGHYAPGSLAAEVCPAATALEERIDRELHPSAQHP